MGEVLVIDPGSSTWKVGFSGEDVPQTEYPSMLDDGVLTDSPDRNHYRGGEVSLARASRN